MTRLAERLKAKIRGIFGLGIIGGVAGFVTGAVWGVVSSAVRSGVFLDVDFLRFVGRMALGNATGFMMIGVFTGAGFGAMLAVVDSKRSIEELPLWRMALFGALVGAAFPPIFVIWRIGVAAYLGSALSFVPVMGVLGGIGGVLTASMVAMAKRASRAELSAVDEAQSLREAE